MSFKKRQVLSYYHSPDFATMVVDFLCPPSEVWHATNNTGKIVRIFGKQRVKQTSGNDGAMIKALVLVLLSLGKYEGVSAGQDLP